MSDMLHDNIEALEDEVTTLRKKLEHRTGMDIFWADVVHSITQHYCGIITGLRHKIDLLEQTNKETE